MLTLNGMHHVSGLTADIVQSHDFYTNVLGLRLVKRTVNQDSPGMYHLFFADYAGSSGSDMTFFDFPNAVRERRGNQSFTRTTFRVSGEDALDYWAARLDDAEIWHRPPTLRDGRWQIDFDDYVGTQLALIDDQGVGPRGMANPASDVPAAWQIQGLGYSTAAVVDLAPTRRFLEDGLNMHEDRRYTTDGFETTVFAMGDGGPHAELHVAVRPDLPRSRYGSSSIHHIALAVPEATEMAAWLAQLAEAGYPNSGLKERYYFQSIYIREPNGLLVELATEGPGFTVDEPLETLGQRLALPPFLEPRRVEIEAFLRPLALESEVEDVEGLAAIDG